MKSIISAIDGYKSYIVGIGAGVFGVLVVVGVVTPDQLSEWATVAGGAIIAFGAAIMTVRSAIKKLEQVLKDKS